MAMQTFTGSVALSASTGNQSITGVGFQGKAGIFTLTERTSDGSSATGRWSIGFGVSSTQRGAIANAAEDNVSPQDTDRRIVNDKIITLINNSQTVIEEVDFVSWNADGFTINITTTDTTQRILNFIIFGGSDLTNATVLQGTSKTSTGNQGYTGAGFQPDAIMLITIVGSTAPNFSTTAGIEGIGFGTSSTARGSMSSNMGNAGASGVAEKTQQTNKIMDVTNGGATFLSADLVSLDADGFTLNWTTAQASARYFFALCLKGGRYKVGSFNQKTSTGTDPITGVGFPPTGLVLLSFNEASTSSLVQDVGNSIGFVSSTSQRNCIWWGYQNGVNPGVVDEDLDRASIIKMMTEGTPTINAEADLSSWDSDGFTPNWSTADATAREILYLAVGSNAVAASTGIMTTMKGWWGEQ